MSGTDDRSAREIEREVEIERTQLEDTLGELSDRMQPGALFEQALEYMRAGDGSDLAGRLAREMRANPLPVLLIGVGLAWLAASAGRSGPAPRGAAYRDPRTRPMIRDGGDPYAPASPVAPLPPAARGIDPDPVGDRALPATGTAGG